MKQSKVLTAHVPLPLAERVDQMAARLDRSRGWVVKQALSAWVEREEERRQLTLEALADVDAGQVIDHQAVQAWADRLGSDDPAASSPSVRGLQWTQHALSDLARLYDFLASANPEAATAVVQALVRAPTRILDHPSIGEKLPEFEPRNIRRLLVGHFEMRYEMGDGVVYILRVWHARE